jgi:cathepsin B
MTRGEIKRFMGTFTANTPKWKAHRAANPLPETDVEVFDLSALPVNFTATDKWPQCASTILKIRDQSDCGSCWAFGSTESFNDRLCINYNYTKVLSAQNTASCCNPSNGCSGSNGCDGGFTLDAWNYFGQSGIVTGDSYLTIGSGSSCVPYSLPECGHHEASKRPPCSSICGAAECATPVCTNTCTEKSYPIAFNNDKQFAKSAYTVTGVSAIMSEIYNRGSVAASFEVYDDFLTYKSGVYVRSSNQAMGGHAIRIIGWGTTSNGVDYWVATNSWNYDWGNNGTFWIQKGVDMCSIEDDIVAGLV